MRVLLRARLNDDKIRFVKNVRTLLPLISLLTKYIAFKRFGGSGWLVGLDENRLFFSGGNQIHFTGFASLDMRCLT